MPPDQQPNLPLRVPPYTPRRQRRLARANWWFERMREVVDKAIDHPPQEPTTSPGRVELEIFEQK